LTVTGVVNPQREAEITLRLRGPSGIESDLSFIVDTGFTGQIVITPATAAKLQLKIRSTGGANMADGSPRTFDVFSVDVWWDGQWRQTSAAAIGGDPLIGMRLLSDHRLTIDVIPGGAVVIANTAL
jgi:clan AA aspartic protease